MNRIVFDANWNCKLWCDSFVTFRLFTKERYHGFVQKSLENFDVYVGSKRFCVRQLLFVEKVRLRDLPRWVCWVDAGMGFGRWVDLLKHFYGKEEEWRGLDTELIMLVFKKDGDGK